MSCRIAAQRSRSRSRRGTCSCSASRSVNIRTRSAWPRVGRSCALIAATRARISRATAPGSAPASRTRASCSSIGRRADRVARDREPGRRPVREEHAQVEQGGERQQAGRASRSTSTSASGGDEAEHEPGCQSRPPRPADGGRACPAPAQAAATEAPTGAAQDSPGRSAARPTPTCARHRRTTSWCLGVLAVRVASPVQPRLTAPDRADRFVISRAGSTRPKSHAERTCRVPARVPRRRCATG